MIDPTPAARPLAAPAGAARAARAPRPHALGLPAALAPLLALAASCGGDPPSADPSSAAGARARSAAESPPTRAESTDPRGGGAALAPLDGGAAGPTRAAAEAEDASLARSRLRLRFRSDRYAPLDERRRPAVRAALEWLAAHQDDDGGWDCDGFTKHDPATDRPDGAGDPAHDVGVTALALLAFLGDGHSAFRGEYRDTVREGALWLIGHQDQETGLILHTESHAFLYGHAVATIALAELAEVDRSPTFRNAAIRAVRCVEAARNPYRVWRYAVTPNGQNDTSITAWMATALDAARRAGIEVDEDAFVDTLAWFEDLSDGNGRVGYRRAGETSARIEGRNGQYPTEGGEALSACALFTSAMLGETAKSAPRLREHADLLLQALPEWSDDGRTNDMYYWYYGAHAMQQLGGRDAVHFQNALDEALLPNQRTAGAAAGSWDPNGPWGFSGGRVYSTAILTLALEAPFRYTRTKPD